jgi:hypothetical protein
MYLLLFLFLLARRCQQVLCLGLERGLKPLPNGCLGIIIKINLTMNYQLLLDCNKVHRAPEHHPDASLFLDLIWLSTCECCASEITSGYCTMSLLFFLRLWPKCLKHHIIKIRPNDGACLFRHQYFHGAQNRIHLSTDHTMLVSRLYCLKKNSLIATPITMEVL